LRIRRANEVDVFLGKVERSFGDHAHFDQARDNGVDFLREGTRETACRRARRGPGRGIDEICDALGLCQIQLVVKKCALGELAGKGKPRAQLEAAPQDQSKYGRSAMTVKFEHRLPRIRRRCGEP
jgi:hypothetical protein